MDLEEAVFVKISTDTSLSPLVGTRVYPLTLPAEAEFPLILYTVVSNEDDITHDESDQETLATTRVQFEVWSPSFKSIREVSKALFDCWQGFKGAITSGAGSLTVQGSWRVSKMTGREGLVDLYWRRQDFIIKYLE